MNRLIESETDDTASSVSGIILAGGDCRRMGGTNKALLRVGGRRIIEREADVLCRMLDEVVVITNTPDDYLFLGLPTFRDLLPRKGALGGIYTGLMSITAPWGILVACDMPFLDARVLSRMMTYALEGSHQLVIPRINGRLHTMHAMYSKECIAPLEKCLKRTDLSVFNLFELVDVMEVQEADLAVFDAEYRFVTNVNTPEDLECARHLADRELLTSQP